jgi:hypothetical protein
MVADKLLNTKQDPGSPVTFSDQGNGTFAEVVAIGKQFNAGGFSTVQRLLSAAASTNSTLVKATVGRVYLITGYNAAASVRFLKLYNKSTAPTVGTDTPIATFALAPSAMFAFDFDAIGLSFSAGIGFGLSNLNPDADTTALTAGDIVGMNIFYA